MPATLEAHLHGARDGSQRLYLHHLPPPDVGVRAFVVYVHPWAEEMNKSRRMAAMTSRALAADGVAVLQVDLAGCGDSGSDFAGATWQTWLDDIHAAIGWMQARHAGASCWLWGLRSGALLCVQAASQRNDVTHLLLWQPVTQGKTALQQFLRLRAAASMASGNAKAAMDEVRAELAAGRPVDIAGYALHRGLSDGLADARLQVFSPKAGGTLVWLETGAQADGTLNPAQSAGVAAWSAAGWQVKAEAVPGPAFWQTTEIEDAPALVTATRHHVGSVMGRLQ